MKSLLLALTLILSTSTVFAQDSAQNFSEDYETNARNPRKAWMCEASGMLETGGPGGIWRSVYGYGPDQQSAASDAYGRCSSMGLRGCVLGVCGQR